MFHWFGYNDCYKTSAYFVYMQCTCSKRRSDWSATRGIFSYNTITNPLPTSSARFASVLVDNSTDQPLAVSSPSLWALIAVAIMLLLTLLVTIIIAICIVRNMSMKLKETKKGNVRDSDGEYTNWHDIVIRTFLLLKIFVVKKTKRKLHTNYFQHKY